jgi:hypothetical protein
VKRFMNAKLQVCKSTSNAPLLPKFSTKSGVVGVGDARGLASQFSVRRAPRTRSRGVSASSSFFMGDEFGGTHPESNADPAPGAMCNSGSHSPSRLRKRLVA